MGARLCVGCARDRCGVRILGVVDAFIRECLAFETDTSLCSRRTTRVLEQIIERRGLPQFIICDNGPELTSRHFLSWCEERQIEMIHIQPAKPMQNGYVESFNSRLRDECLNASWFRNLVDARGKSVSGEMDTIASSPTVAWPTERQTSSQAR